MGWRLELQRLLLPPELQKWSSSLRCAPVLRLPRCSPAPAPLHGHAPASSRSGNSVRLHPDAPASARSGSSAPRCPRRRAAHGLDDSRCCAAPTAPRGRVPTPRHLPAPVAPRLGVCVVARLMASTTPVAAPLRQLRVTTSRRRGICPLR
jgi:hypothetical protein